MLEDNRKTDYQMRNFFFTVVLLMVVSLTNLHANISIDDQYEFIQKHSAIAVAEMYRSGIPASITLAQAIKESFWGTAPLANHSNNYFGIKCKPEWTGEKYYHEDDDYDENGQIEKSCFRVYNNIEQSFIDHTNFLMERSNYSDCFRFDSDNYVDWAIHLKKGGYATLPSYAIDLIKIIEKYDLHQFDVKGYQRPMYQMAESSRYYNPNNIIVHHEKPATTPIVAPRRTADPAPQYSISVEVLPSTPVIDGSSIPVAPPAQRIEEDYIPKWKKGVSMDAKGEVETATLPSHVPVQKTVKKNIPQGKKSVGTYKRHTRNIQYRPSASSNQRR